MQEINDIDRNVLEFSKERIRYEKLSEYICNLITNHCSDSLVHTTEFRAKDIESFEKKCRKTSIDGSIRYPKPFEQVTDLAGVRVIVFLRDSVDIVCEEISKLFDVVASEDVGERVYKSGKFGYQSKHLLVRLGSDRAQLVENSRLIGLICEIQVRTLLQHAWAEMEHDIQYKSVVDIPLDLSKRFSALAGLLEIADREFASIQRDSETLRKVVKEDLVSDLTRQGLQENNDTATTLLQNLTLDARDLVQKGEYEKAIDVYTSKLKIEPNSYTLFVGRARAKFLFGNLTDALSDLDLADSLSGDPSRTIRLREMIQKGDDFAPNFRSPAEQISLNSERSVIAEAMREGDGIKVFIEYGKLENSGLNKAFALLGKAMGCILERDVIGATGFKNSLDVRYGTPMAVNLCALDCILEIMRGENEVDFRNLDIALRSFPNFSLDFSPLGDLRVGLAKKKYDETDRLETIFSYIEDFDLESAEIPPVIY